jgi:hypothetical protein
MAHAPTAIFIRREYVPLQEKEEHRCAYCLEPITLDRNPGSMYQREVWQAPSGELIYVPYHSPRCPLFSSGQTRRSAFSEDRDYDE